MIKYDIQYEWLKDELVISESTESAFNRLVKIANNVKIELSDEDFMKLLKIELHKNDSIWFICRMKHYEKSLNDCLLSYILS